jgi:hypothetical protein
MAAWIVVTCRRQAVSRLTHIVRRFTDAAGDWRRLISQSPTDGGSSALRFEPGEFSILSDECRGELGRRSLQARHPLL